MKRKWLFPLLQILAVGLVYFAAAKLGLKLAFLNASVSPVWPPTGVAIVAVWWLGYFVAPGIFLGAFLANLSTPLAPLTALAIATGNTLEALIAVFLIRRFIGTQNPFNRAGDFLKFVLLVPLASTAVSATIGTLSLCLSDPNSWARFGTLWLTWWLGDGVAALLIVPLLFSWIEKSPQRWTAKRVAEWSITLALIVLAASLVFTTLFFPGPEPYPIGHLIVPLLLWAAVRFGPRGAATAVAVMSTVAIFGTSHGIGPFAQADINKGLMLLQIYVADMAVTTLVLAAVVSERQRTSEEVSFLASIVESTDDAVVGKTLDGKIMSWNKGAERIYGYTATEAIGQPVSMIYPPDKADDVVQILGQLKRGEPVENSEAERIRKDGTRIYVSLSISPIRDSSGRFQSASSIARDITARKQAEERIQSLNAELKRRVEEVQTLIETAPIGLAVATDPECNYIWSNPEFTHMLGSAKGQNASKSAPGNELAFKIFRQGIEVPSEDLPMQRACREGREILDEELAIVRNDGVIIHELCRATPLKDEHGQVRGCIGVFLDITDRKRAEEEYQLLLESEHAARAEAEAANRTKDEFLATLSHELRTPLNAVVGWAGMLRSGKLDQANSVHALEIIDRNARVQAQLIEDILDVSRIVSGKVRLEIRPVELAPVIEAAVDSIRPTAQSKNLSLRLAIDSSVGPVSGDPDRLQQVVWNLLSNAVKFTTAGEVEVRLERDEDYVQVVVKDTGQGIKTDFLPFVFDRFRQADGTLTRRHKGLGLGLAIVRHLVELHGGSVEAESAGEGQGATFRVRLPVLSGWANAPPKQVDNFAALAKEALPMLKGLRVLAVDDEVDARELLSTMLRNFGVDVHAAGSAIEALEVLDAAPIDILISDVEMPDVDGYSLVQRIRTLERATGGNLPAIALTAHARSEDRERALQAGFNVHLAKPIIPAELRMLLVGFVRKLQDGSVPPTAVAGAPPEPDGQAASRWQTAEKR